MKGVPANIRIAVEILSQKSDENGVNWKGGSL